MDGPYMERKSNQSQTKSSSSPGRLSCPAYLPASVFYSSEPPLTSIKFRLRQEGKDVHRLQPPLLLSISRPSLPPCHQRAIAAHLSQHPNAAYLFQHPSAAHLSQHPNAAYL